MNENRIEYDKRAFSGPEQRTQRKLTPRESVVHRIGELGDELGDLTSLMAPWDRAAADELQAIDDQIEALFMRLKESNPRAQDEQELPEEDRFTPGKLPRHYLESKQHTFCKVEGESLDKIGSGDPDDVFLASSLADVTCLNCLRSAVANLLDAPKDGAEKT